MNPVFCLLSAALHKVQFLKIVPYEGLQIGDRKLKELIVTLINILPASIKIYKIDYVSKLEQNNKTILHHIMGRYLLA